MFKSLLCSLFVTFSVFPAQYHYDVDMTFKRGPTPSDPRATTVVNQKEVFCPCGKPPVFTMFFYGNPSHYCAQHIPEIEYVRPLTKDNLDEFLASLNNMNMNGAHCGMENDGKK
jgi:hypothetical protein